MDLFTLYLAGPIIAASNDDVIPWRDELTQFLSLNNIGVKDPTKKDHPKFGKYQHGYLTQLREEYGFDSPEVREFVQWTFEADLQLIRESDGVLAHLPQATFSVGTSQELFFGSFCLGLPTFVVTNLDPPTQFSAFLQQTTTKHYGSFVLFKEDITSVVEVVQSFVR